MSVLRVQERTQLKKLVNARKYYGSIIELGTTTLSGGTATVSNSSIQSDDLIYSTVMALGTVATPQALWGTNIVPNVSFDIISADNTDTSTVGWMIVRAPLA